MTPTDNLSDNDLLLAYGQDGERTAFEQLARRHVDMIFAVSLRRSNNRQLAEEATQNVLLSLSTKARKLSAKEQNLTAWLHKSTRFEVAKLQRRESRIRKREEAYAKENMNHSTQSEDEAFQHLYPMLDEAIDNLRTPDREVIVRRYLEGQSFSSIGKALGISEDAAQKRTSRAFDQLNRFFKRKAGVTVSAAAMAAGISQHCAEAAPAACLHFTAASASTGIASFFTTATITTMSIGKITAIAAAAVVASGGAIALLHSGENTSEKTVATSPSTSSDSGTPPTSPPSNKTVAADAEKPYSPNEELAKLEAMSPHPSPEEMARRLSVRHAQLLKDLTEELSLSAAQAAELKTVLDSRVKTFRTSLDETADEMAMLTKAGSLIRGAGLREEMAGILSEAQLSSFDAREQKLQQSQAESQAYRELAKLTPVLKLTEQQKDQVFEKLQISSAEKLSQDAVVRAFMALMQNKTPIQVDITDMAEAKFFNEMMDGPNALPPDSPEFKNKAIEVIGGQINKQVEHLAPILDQTQKQRYYDHLVSKSPLPMFGIELSVPSEK